MALAPVVHDEPSYFAHKTAGLVALGLGVLTFVVVAISQDRLWCAPDPRLSTPGFGVTVLAAIFSIARREKAHALWLAGLGCAAAALVLGWFLMLAIVVGATAILIAILHVVM